MGQYNDKVELQRKILLAEEYKDTVMCLHAHSLSSMWYDKRPQDTANGNGVVDVQFMDGRIERTLKNGKKITLVKGRTGEELVQEVTRNLADSGKELA